jgi:hypothetical protein
LIHVLLPLLLAQMPEAKMDDVTKLLIDSVAVASGFLVVLKVIEHFKAKPPMSQQLVDFGKECEKRFATKTELIAAQQLNAQARNDKARQIQDLKDEVEKLDTDLKAQRELIAGIPHQVIVLLNDARRLTA